ncbi:MULTISPECIES: ABC transporter permease [Bacillus cereus group]|uniref:Bacitracin ABC transporter permease n=1 Tax=Bacillus cereus TaxID=1396 RepID=A0A9X8ITS0_BACCE|nr:MULTISPECIES: ABC transporter permease subunit [Bacillus cereus group]QEL82479.1 bacitracin ABC transporter permease [Bacillus sp. JAS24-2]RWQ69571.1 bacitracin ABC transporter permease [Bacillus cereus]HDR4909119.1 ABC transporter permease subunit [Bacillus cereus]
MFNLVYNEIYKIFKRKQTSLLFIAIAILIMGFGFIAVQYFPNTSGDWKKEYTERTAEIEKRLGSTKQDLINQKSGDELVKEYQLKMKYLDTNTPPAGDSPLSFMKNTGQVVFPVLLPFILVYASTIFANEYNWGTYKFLMTRPATRFKILTAKYIAIVIFSALLFIFSMLFSFFYGLIIYKFQQPAWTEFFVQNGHIVKQNILLEVSKYYLLSWLPTLVYAAFAFMISVLTKSSGGAIGISLFMALSDSLVLYPFARYEWAKYLLPANTGLYGILKGGSFIPGITLPFASSMLFIYLLIFLGISYVVFLKRDLI